MSAFSSELMLIKFYFKLAFYQDYEQSTSTVDCRAFAPWPVQSLKILGIQLNSTVNYVFWFHLLHLYFEFSSDSDRTKFEVEMEKVKSENIIHSRIQLNAQYFQTLDRSGSKRSAINCRCRLFIVLIENSINECFHLIISSSAFIVN